MLLRSLQKTSSEAATEEQDLDNTVGDVSQASDDQKENRHKEVAKKARAAAKERAVKRARASGVLRRRFHESESEV